MAEDIANYVATTVASERTGVPGRTLRHWVKRGKVAVIHGNAGKPVRLEDVERLAALVGKEPGKPDGFDVAEEGKLGGIGTDVAATLAASPRTQLAAVMGEWVLPVADRIGALERENGMLAAEREAPHGV